MKATLLADAIEIPWQASVKNIPALAPSLSDIDQPDPKLLQAIVRAHAWLRDLQSGKLDSVEALAASVKLHPKVVRQVLLCVPGASHYRSDLNRRTTT